MLALDRDLDHARGLRTVVHVESETLEARPWTSEFREAMRDTRCGSGWDCYDIFSDGPDSIIWVVPSDGYRSPSTLLSGKRL